MARARLSGTDLWYDILGEGSEPLVLIGGIPLGRHGLDALVPYLRDRFRLLIFDQRGCGESANPDSAPVTLARAASDVLELLDHVGFETANIHGTSSGGLVGLNLAVRNPDRVKTLILNGLYVRPDTYWRFYNRVLSDFLTHAGIGRGVAAFVSERNLGGGFLDDHPEVVDKLILPSIASTPLPIWQAWLDEASTIDLVSELDQCAVRTLLISGEHDRMLDVAPSGVGMRRMQEMMRVAELNILAGAGHFTAIERPGEHARAVIAFVNSGPDN